MPQQLLIPLAPQTADKNLTIVAQIAEEQKSSPADPKKSTRLESLEAGVCDALKSQARGLKVQSARA
eukprot:1190226-Prorocentrum_minimum.AAC.1